MSRPELDRRLTDLRQRLPQMRQQNPHDSDFWAAFSHETRSLSRDTLSAEDTSWLQNRIVSILATP
ncbi:hypothetical protein E4582_09365 [Luteimonas yindakuii]|uniref:Uncharacterized protein n=1 Tax=Luteimonas yindakuii TaxID=2565782 RepID=A0A4Z1RJQ6_9GAMM|nr:hypothetical protein [Luteimonas yindakuii]QCO68508.1 hypothetical protein E5843_13380 [Luteimonas yindakuii]TKS54947.1 hypothetical protein E4582_09365 [Luteimonas yindakuii]